MGSYLRTKYGPIPCFLFQYKLGVKGSLYSIKIKVKIQFLLLIVMPIYVAFILVNCDSGMLLPYCRVNDTSSPLVSHIITEILFYVDHKTSWLIVLKTLSSNLFQVLISLTPPHVPSFSLPKEATIIRALLDHPASP